MAFEIPDACTLPTAERPVRLAEFDELLTGPVRSADRESPTRLTLRLHSSDDDLEEITRDLAAREAQCCSFFGFTVAADGSDVVLGIEVPPQHTSILDSLQARSGVIE
ncbi:hypothetical protein OCAE111667_25425 [Occultella aeris]|uniref:Arsenate reductase n=1 Tax=Occultella aeris TaxID=2761496 RepID=A0A7M4DJG8_9MICO|nr:hypothetical protein [Occultella aeris]VZO37182.1 hypothetical protein HALOF300_02275 [Occultella aeris]